MCFTPRGQRYLAGDVGDPEVASARHRGARRHKPRRLLVLGGAVVAIVAVGDLTGAMWAGQPQSSTDSSREQAAEQYSSVAPSLPDRTGRSDGERPSRTDGERPSRTDERRALGSKPQDAGATQVAPAIATKTRFLTEDLNVWSGPGEETTLLTVLDEGSKIQATGRVIDGWAEVDFNEKLRWVNAEYLSTDKPEDDTASSGGDTSGDDSTGGDTSGGDSSGGLSDAPCASGSAVEDGLVANAIAVHRAICAEFPEVTTYYGLRPGDDGEHGTGQAIDSMVPDSATGDAIAEFVQDHYRALGVSEIIWSQRIWTVQRMSEGWRWMEDRGSDTANHYDHVHVTVY
jgi:hypothetical protein